MRRVRITTQETRGKTSMSLYRGGFLAGYRTYAVAGTMILAALVRWAVDGDTTFTEFLDVLFSEQVLTGLGLAALRAGVSRDVAGPLG